MDRPLDLFLSLSTRHGAGRRGILFETLKVLEDSPSVCYILDDRLRLIYCNPAWDRFADANGGRQLTRDSLIGTNLFAAIPLALTSAYAQAFQSVSATGRVWTKLYECSSPGRFRKFRMRIHPLKSRDWFLVTNALVVDRQHKKAVNHDHHADDYVNRGLVTMCSHCRCSRRVDQSDKWDFVPRYLRLKGLDPLTVSHGLCPICRAYFYPDI